MAAAVRVASPLATGVGTGAQVPVVVVLLLEPDDPPLPLEDDVAAAIDDDEALLLLETLLVELAGLPEVPVALDVPLLPVDRPPLAPWAVEMMPLPVELTVATGAPHAETATSASTLHKTRTMAASQCARGFGAWPAWTDLRRRR
jgi:hypothetical protein